MHSMRLSRGTAIAALAAALVIGVGGGVLAYSTWGSSTKTVVRQVTVDSSTPASSTDTLSVGEIYRRANKGVVELTVSSTQNSPFGLEETVTSGIVSALHRQIDAPNNFTISDAIQTDAAINHGNSGGPLLDMHGRVIGVNAQIQSDSGGNEGVGFAIPANTVKSIASQILANGKAEHAFLGVRAVTIPASVAGDLNLAAGAEIATVRPGTPAAKAGLHASTGTRTVNGQAFPTGGDVITSVGGTKITTVDGLIAAVNAKKPGDVVSITYVRAGKSHMVRVTLTSRPSQ